VRRLDPHPIPLGTKRPLCDRWRIFSPSRVQKNEIKRVPSTAFSTSFLCFSASRGTDEFARPREYSHGPRLVWGIGKRVKMDWLEVRWPFPGGGLQRFAEVPVDRCVTIVQGAVIVKQRVWLVDSR
jgi:hypothetical protein